MSTMIRKRDACGVLWYQVMNSDGNIASFLYESDALLFIAAKVRAEREVAHANT